MVNKTISLPHELILKLSSEENASGLIADLLFSHYRVIDSIDSKKVSLNRELEQNEEEYLMKKQRLLDELKQAEEQKRTIEVKERELQDIEERGKARLEEKRKNVRINFKELSGRDITEEELEEFMDINYKGNIFDFVDKKTKKLNDDDSDIVKQIIDSSVDQRIC